MNNISHLIRLANRIGDFFVAFPNRAEGIEGVADHIGKFWDPRMRVALLDYLEQNPAGTTEEASLNPITLEALQQNRQRLMPKATVSG